MAPPQGNTYRFGLHVGTAIAVVQLNIVKFSSAEALQFRDHFSAAMSTMRWLSLRVELNRSALLFESQRELKREERKSSSRHRSVHWPDGSGQREAG